MDWNSTTILNILSNPDKMTGRHSNRYLIYRMLQAMYNRQTLDEQTSEQTKHCNNIGFNSCDAWFLSNVAENSKQYNSLTEKQAFKVASKLKKYVRQLTEIATGNIQQSLFTSTKSSSAINTVV